MKGEDSSRAPWMVMQTWKERCTGRNTLCASPRIPLGSRRSGSPGGSRPRISNFLNFSIYHSRRLIALLRHNPVTSPSRHLPHYTVLPTTPAMSSDLHSRIHVKVLWSLAQRSWSTVRYDAHVGRVEPTAPRPGQQ
jgi:hypothetical protein